jgi:hypothetical protein
MFAPPLLLVIKNDDYMEADTSSSYFGPTPKIFIVVLVVLCFDAV